MGFPYLCGSLPVYNGFLRFISQLQIWQSWYTFTCTYSITGWAISARREKNNLTWVLGYFTKCCSSKPLTFIPTHSRNEAEIHKTRMHSSGMCTTPSMHWTERVSAQGGVCREEVSASGLRGMSIPAYNGADTRPVDIRSPVKTKTSFAGGKIVKTV